MCVGSSMGMSVCICVGMRIDTHVCAYIGDCEINVYDKNLILWQILRKFVRFGK